MKDTIRDFVPDQSPGARHDEEDRIQIKSPAPDGVSLAVSGGRVRA
jgi:hypothetical protein